MLYAVDDRPHTPHEWESWLTANRTAIVKISAQETGTPDAAELRLIHTNCRHRQQHGTAARHEAHGACLSRMRGNVHVRF